MYIETATGLLAGPYDVISMVKDTSTGRYHLYMLYESRMPGLEDTDPDQLRVIRLKSKMHHTEGAATYEDALEQLAEMRTLIQIADENVWVKPEQVFATDCSQGFAGVFFSRPWRGQPGMPKLAPLEVLMTN